MGAFPNNTVADGDFGILSPIAQNTPLGDMIAISENDCSNTATTWTANRAVYLPIAVTRPVTVIDMHIVVSTQNGNVDAGIYNWAGTRLVSNGGVACGAAGVQTITIADTALSPGWYFMAFASSSSTAVFKGNNLATVAARVSGAQQQSSAYPLPSTATFAAYSVGIYPQLVGSLRSTF